MKLHTVILFCVTAVLALLVPETRSQPTGFAYQGQLREANQPANGSYDLRAILYTSDVGGSQVGPIVTKPALPVVNGLFTTDLDFGPGAFNGEARWLELAVRRNGGDGFTTLDPRQAIRPAPYAQFALTPAGPKGDRGDKGDPGAAGIQGLPGSKGDKGETGVAGPLGAQGIAGVKGDEGPVGPKGLNWRGPWSADPAYEANDAVAENGAAWVAITTNTGSAPAIENPDWDLLAEKGDTGLTGPTGQQGPVGANGPQGAKGEIGLTGPTGLQGPAGPQGNKGDPGAPGIAGPTGPKGDTGLPGSPGEQGIAGIKGDPGPKGPRGLNWRGAWSAIAAYEADDAVAENGAAWVAKVASTGSAPAIENQDWDLLAEKGITGAAGPAGEKGPKGDPGAAGIPGPVGIKGDKGDAGPEGRQGPPGPLKSLNTLHDDVSLLAGPNIFITPSGNTLTISATGSGDNGIWKVNGPDTYFNAGNVGIGTATPSSKLAVRTGSFNPYGIEHSSGAVRLSTYINSGSAWFGTITDHPLIFFVNDGAPSMTINNDGNVGIGTSASPQAKLHVLASNARLRLESTSLGDTPTTEYVSPAGHWLTGIGGAGGTDNKYFIRDAKAGDAGITRVVVDSTGNVGIGTSSPTSGKLHVEGGADTAVYASSSAGFAIAADGHATQTLDKGGFVKAMVYVKDNTIVRCFNSFVPADQSPVGGCGITLSALGLGRYKVNFGFQVTDRFVTVTPELSFGLGGATLSTANFYFGDDPNVVEVYTTGVSPFPTTPFMLVVF